MKLVAITGFIGCGKTTLSEEVRSLGYPVLDVDGWVRRLYRKKNFIRKVVQLFPEVAEGEGINKRKLRQIVFSDIKELQRLEGLIHPFLNEMLKEFIRKNAFYDGLLFLDVALLHKMGWNKYCYRVILADADERIQMQRVMRRDNISEREFRDIVAVQRKGIDGERTADAVIDTNRPKNVLRAELAKLITEFEYDGKRDCF